jgi:hypothetical protein
VHTYDGRLKQLLCASSCSWFLYIDGWPISFPHYLIDLLPLVSFMGSRRPALPAAAPASRACT